MFLSVMWNIKIFLWLVYKDKVIAEIKATQSHYILSACLYTKHNKTASERIQNAKFLTNKEEKKEKKMENFSALSQDYYVTGGISCKTWKSIIYRFSDIFGSAIIVHVITSILIFFLLQQAIWFFFLSRLCPCMLTEVRVQLLISLQHIG